MRSFWNSYPTSCVLFFSLGTSRSKFIGVWLSVYPVLSWVIIKCGGFQSLFLSKFWIFKMNSLHWDKKWHERFPTGRRFWSSLIWGMTTRRKDGSTSVLGCGSKNVTLSGYLNNFCLLGCPLQSHLYKCQIFSHFSRGYVRHLMVAEQLLLYELFVRPCKSYMCKCLQSSLPSTVASQSREDALLKVTAWPGSRYLSFPWSL